MLRQALSGCRRRSLLHQAIRFLENDGLSPEAPNMPSPPVSRGVLIGVDFDNTLVTYEQVFRDVALARGLIDPDFAGTKQEIRDRIRLLQDGELAWQ
jgi:hypothetical protein